MLENMELDISPDIRELHFKVVDFINLAHFE